MNSKIPSDDGKFNFDIINHKIFENWTKKTKENVKNLKIAKNLLKWSLNTPWMFYK